MELTKEQEHILRHSLGADSDRPGYRNHFVSGEGTTDWPILQQLVELGLMISRPYQLAQNDTIFHVTENGQELIGVKYDSR